MPNCSLAQGGEQAGGSSGSRATTASDGLRPITGSSPPSRPSRSALTSLGGSGLQSLRPLTGKLMEPVLSGCAERCLGRPGGPPRAFARHVEAREICSAGLSDVDELALEELHPSCMLQPWSANAARQRPTSNRAPANCLKALMDDCDRHIDELDMYALHEYTPSKRPLPCQLAETLRGRVLWGQGHIFRHEMDAAVEEWDEQMTELARYRFDISRQTRDRDRLRAAERRSTQACGLRWTSQKFLNKQLLDPLTNDRSTLTDIARTGSSRSMSGVAYDKRGTNGRRIDDNRQPSQGLARAKVTFGLSLGTSNKRGSKSSLRIRMRNLRRNTREWRRQNGHGRSEFLITPPEEDTGEVEMKLVESIFHDDGLDMLSQAPSPVYEHADESSDRIVHRMNGLTDRRHGSDGTKRVGFEGDIGNQFVMDAFLRFDGDMSGTLDQPELRASLAELGLRGKTTIERQAVRNILWSVDELQISYPDFANKVIPVVRKRLFDLRRPKYLQLFQEVDTYGRNQVSVEDTVNDLRRHGIIVIDEVRDDVIKTFSREVCRDCKPAIEPANMDHDMLDREKFILFVCYFTERYDREWVSQFQRISIKFNFTEQEQEAWKNDLVDFYSMFFEYDPCSGKFGSSSGQLTAEQTFNVVRESGYMPRTRQRQVQTLSIIKEQLDAHGKIEFPTFLNIMKRLRDFDRERLHKTFEQCADQELGIVLLCKVSAVLPDVGINPVTAAEKWEVKAVLDDCDEPGSENLSSEDFVMLCQRITARLRVMRRERERQYVLSVGWSEQLFIQLRDAFQVFDEDMSEVLERDELMKTLELLRGQDWQSSQNLNLMFLALGINPKKEINVNFLTFLKMLRMLDEGDNRRQRGAAVGFSPERTDKLYSAFQALEPATPTVARSLLMNVLTDVGRIQPKMQLEEVFRELNAEPLQVSFEAFLRIMKVMEGSLDAIWQFDACVNDILAWPTSNDAEGGSDLDK